MATKTLPIVKDTTVRYNLSTAASSGGGADFHNVVGRGPGDFLYRTAIQFDISTLPTTAYTISSAVIRFKVSTFFSPGSFDYDVLTHGDPIEGTPTIKAYLITKAWTEGTDNGDNLGWGASAPTKWSTFATAGANTFTGVNTSIVGSTVALGSVNLQPVEGGSGQILEVDVRDAFLQWAPTTVNGGLNQPNYGVLICLDNESASFNSNRVNFISSERTADLFAGNATYPQAQLVYEPNLYVTYSLAPTPNPQVSATSPVGSNSRGIATITNLADPRVWTSTSDYAQVALTWAVTLSATLSPIASWRLKIFQTDTNGVLVYDTGDVTDSAHTSDEYLETVPQAEKPSWIPGGWQTGYNGLKKDTVYFWTISVTDEASQSSTDQSGNTFKLRWGQALYEFDAGASYASTSSWEVSYDPVPVNTQAVEVYQATNVRSQALITNVSAAGGTITYTCAGGHSFVQGDIVNITGVAPDAYNLTNATIATASSPTFTVTNAATGTFVAGTIGYATLVAYEDATATISNVTAAAGTVTYTTSAAHGFVAGQKVTITGVTPTAYNLANVTLATASGSSFTVTNAATGTFVSGGRAVMHGRRGISAPLTDISGDGTTITYTGANNYVAGQQVMIVGSNVTAFNAASVTIASATASSFTVNGSASATFTIASLTATGTNVTYTTTANHGFSVGQLVVVAGCTPSGYNTAATGSRITAVTNTTFTIANATTGTLTVAGTARVIPSGAIAESIVSTSGSAISGQTRYLHAHIRTSTDNADTSVQPKLNNVEFSYLSAVQTPDYWTASGASGSTANIVLDSDTRRFGTKSVKISSSTSGDAFIYPFRITAGDDITVVPNTIYSFSCYIKVGYLSGANNIRLRVYPAGTSNPATATVIADSGPHTGYTADNEYWRRLSVTFTTSSSTHAVRPMIYMTNSAGLANDYFWADGILFEEGTVVRSWTPGFVTSGVTFEGGGLNIDTSRGGVLRLRGGLAGARDQISVGSRGLLFGGDTNPVQVYSSTAGQIDVEGGIAATGSLSTTDITASGKINKVTITPPATGSTLTIAEGKTFTSSNSITLTGNDGASVNVGSGGTMMTNPMTSVGDLIIGGNSGAPTRLGGGTAEFVLTAKGAGVAPVWQAATSSSAAVYGIYSTSAQNVASGLTDVLMAFASGNTLANSAASGFSFDPTADVESITVTTAGWYYIQIGCQLDTVTGSSDMALTAYINGAASPRIIRQARNPGNVNPWGTAEGFVYLAANATIQGKVASTSITCNAVKKWILVERL